MTHPDTKFVHGEGESAYHYGAVAEPMVLSTTFRRSSDGTFPYGFDYGREGNPNRSELERRMAALEGGVDGAAFASGMAAALAIFQSLKPGDHVVVSEDIYFGVRDALVSHFRVWGLNVSLVDATNVQNVADHVQQNTRVVFIETPSNPMLQIADIGAISQIARAYGALLVCDNSLATPLFQQPLAHGADMVVHSTTKYVNGHHDAQGGIIITREKSDHWAAVRSLQKSFGAVPSPFNCWLASRGLATLPVRVRHQSTSALILAQRLVKHPNVQEVLHPGLESSPYNELALRQMSGLGSVFSFLVRGTETEAIRVAGAVRLFQRATSFGGPESLIEHRASIEGPATKTPGNLLRVAIGLEDVDDLWSDIAQALEAASAGA